MTLFQTIVSAALHSFCTLSGVDGASWQEAAQNILKWDYLNPSVQHLFLSSIWLALVVIKRHDWISQVASLLRVVLTWTRPSTVDERLPIFFMIMITPSLIAQTSLKEWLESTIQGSTLILILIGAAAIWLAIAHKLGSRFDRKQKTLLSLSYADAVIIGILGMASIFAGVGPVIGFLAAALITNYRPPAAIKITYYVVTLFLFSNVLHLGADLSPQNSEPIQGMGWLQFSIGFLVAFFTAVMTLVSTEQMIEKKSFAPIYWLRGLFISLAVIGLFI